jgi:hypothetical protein
MHLYNFGAKHQNINICCTLLGFFLINVSFLSSVEKHKSIELSICLPFPRPFPSYTEVTLGTQEVKVKGEWS